jgi:hypothetical protein
LNFALAKVPPCSGADVCKAIPFVHAKFSNSNLDVQTIVVFDIDSPLA